MTVQASYSSSASRRVFFDTNVLVYQFDHSAPQKSVLAKELVKQHIGNQTGYISTQVVQEFLQVALSKFQHVLPDSELSSVIRDMLEPLRPMQPNLSFYERALKLRAANSLNFYDALVVQAALDLGCQTLYSEDLQDGRKYDNLVIKNPFKKE